MTPPMLRTIVRLAAIAATVLAGQVEAATYPTNTCVAAKQKAAGAYCTAVAKAWATWDAKQDDAKRDAALQKAADRLATAWTKAETKSLAKGVDCAVTTLAATEAQALVDVAVGDVVAEVNGGLDLGVESQGKCGGKLLGAAAMLCGKVLAAESAFVKKLEKDPDGAKRAASQAKALVSFTKRWTGVVAKGCPTTGSDADTSQRIDALNDRLVFDTTVSPQLDDTQYTTITPDAAVPYDGRTYQPICKDGSPYAFFAKRGTVNKLVIYYQGGGACWENVTCSFNGGVCDPNVGPGDNPNNGGSGFGDLDNPDNPFRDWNAVFVSYCSCDIHFGDASRDYTGIFPPIHVEHRGYHNARVVEKFTREHFVNPERVFVTGSSAGAYGAWFNAPLHQFVWPASHFDVLADAGNGVITPDFLANEFPTWNFAGNLPDTIPGLEETLNDGTGIPGYTKVVASFFPDTRWAQYTTAFDGNLGGQTGFYNVMLNPGNVGAWLNWWNSSCAFNAQMTLQAEQTAAENPDNYRYYIGVGSRHTIWGSDRVYTSTAGGVPLLVDWVNAMLDGTPDWTNVQCTDCNVLLPNDPRPNPLVPPFVQDGSDVVIECGSASGAFVEGE